MLACSRLTSEKQAVKKPQEKKPQAKKEPDYTGRLVSGVQQVSPNAGDIQRKLMMYMGGTALAGGALGYGATRLAGALRKPTVEIPEPTADPVDLPYPQVATKLAMDPSVSNKQVGERIPTFGLRHWLGAAANKVSEHPMAYIGLPTAAVGSTLLGSHLAQGHIRASKEKAEAAEMAKAQKDYDDAMLAQYDPHTLHTLSEKVGAALDQLYDALEKQSMDWPVENHKHLRPEWSDKSLGARMGLMGLGVLGAAGVGTYAGYKWNEGRKKENLLADALKQRAIIRAQTHPEPVQINPIARQMPEQAEEQLSAE